MTWTILLNALAAIPSLVNFVETAASAITLWLIQRQTTQTLGMIADAAALSANAKTEQDIANASKAWQSALSQPRISP